MRHPLRAPAILAFAAAVLFVHACDSDPKSSTPPPATEFSATLTGAAEVPPVTTTATGEATAVLTPDEATLTLTATWSGLSGDATGAHIHKGAKDVAGPVVKPITINGTAGSLTWSSNDADTPLTADHIADLRAGLYYVNIHTAANPGGEIRGQLEAK